MSSTPPPSGYGYYAPPPHPGWQPPPPRQHGAASLATAIISGILAVPALLITLVTGHNAAVCNSGIGQLGQAFDQTAARDCAAVNAVHILAILALVVLAAGCLIATLVYLLGRRPVVSLAAWSGPVPPSPQWSPPPPPRTPAPPPPGYSPRGQSGPPPAPPPSGYH